MAEACFTSLFFFYKTFSGSLLTSQFYCYMICDTERSSEGSAMYIEIDFNSDEALYVQLCNQIILGIATSRFREGEQLPSVRQLADTIGINMHTVNKAYSILQQEGFVKIDRRRGAIIAVDINKLQALRRQRMIWRLLWPEQSVRTSADRIFMSLSTKYTITMKRGIIHEFTVYG